MIFEKETWKIIQNNKYSQYGERYHCFTECENWNEEFNKSTVPGRITPPPGQRRHHQESAADWLPVQSLADDGRSGRSIGLHLPVLVGGSSVFSPLGSPERWRAPHVSRRTERLSVGGHSVASVKPSTARWSATCIRCSLWMKKCDHIQCNCPTRYVIGCPPIGCPGMPLPPCDARIDVLPCQTAPSAPRSVQLVARLAKHSRCTFGWIQLAAGRWPPSGCGLRRVDIGVLPDARGGRGCFRNTAPVFC